MTKHHDPRAVRYFLLAPHYRSTIEFSPDDEDSSGSLNEAGRAIERIDSFLERASKRALPLTETETVLELPQWLAFAAAMDDDLGTPQAVATLFEAIRSGNQALRDRDDEQLARIHTAVVMMLDVLGLNPDSPQWQRDNSGPDLAPVVDGLVEHLLEQRTAARAAKDWATADAIRDTLAGLGLAITDTPDGPGWSLEH